MTAEMPEGFRQLPHNIEAEQAYLGAVLINNEALDRTRSFLKPDMFYEPVHRRIYASIIKTVDAGNIASHVTLRRAFHEDEALREVEGGKYLAALAEAAETIFNAIDFARAIQDLACKRAIINAAQDAINKTFDPTCMSPSSEISSELSAQMDAIRTTSASGLIMSVSDVAEGLVKNLNEGVSIISTGFDAIDTSMGGGMRSGCVYVVEAPGKTFKTGVLAGVFDRAALHGSTASLMISLEMSPSDIVQRSMAGQAGVWFQGLERKSTRTRVKHKIDDYRRMAAMKANQAFTAHIPSATLDNILSVMSDAVFEKGVKLILIDYYQLISGKRHDQSMADHLEEVAYRVVSFAAKHGIAIMIASQSNNDGGTLRSGGLRRACSWLCSLEKVKVNTGAIDMDETGIVGDVQVSRYGPACEIGSKFSPAFKIAPGPILLEWNE